ncbi:MAG TPA: hypothetical protein VGO78_19830, partial [Acidimicrobiales bacterium]|nr:hypothetical protein [Acidimicrobiales bacterium]
MKMAAREILRRPRSFFVPVAILLLLALLLLYPSAILDGILEDTSAAIENAPADLIVYSKEANGVILRSRVDSALRSQVTGVDGVDQVASFDVILFAGRVEGRDQPVGFAVQASDQPIGGQVPGPGEALADSSLREKAGLHEGSEVIVGPLRVPVKIVGFTHGTNLWFAGGLVVDKATWLATLGQVAPAAPGETPDGADLSTTDPATQLPPGPPDSTSTTSTTTTSSDSSALPTGPTTPAGSTTTAPNPFGSDEIVPLAQGARAQPTSTTTTASTTTTVPTSTTTSPTSTSAVPTTSIPASTTTVPAGAAPGDEAAPPPEPPGAGTQALLVQVKASADVATVAAAIDEATGGATQSLTRADAVRAMPGVEQQESTFGYIRLVTLTVALVVVGLF